MFEDSSKQNYLNFNDKNLNHINSFEISYLSQKAKQYEFEGRNLFQFGFANSPFSPPKNLDNFSVNRGDEAYYNPQGLIELRELIAKFHSTDTIDLTADNVFIAPGAKMMIFSILAIFKKAIIFNTAPSVSFYEFQAQILGHKVKNISTKQTNNFLLDPKELEQELKSFNNLSDKQKILIFNSPGNLNGSIYSQNHLRIIADICRKYNVLVISNEMLAMLSYEKFDSIINYYPEGTIVTTGISKSYAASDWRFGCCFYSSQFNNKIKSSLLSICSSSYSYVAYPIQQIIINLYNHLLSDNCLIAKQRTILKYLADSTFDKFTNAGIATKTADSGFCLLLDFVNFKPKFENNNIFSDTNLCHEILDTNNVVLLPASLFGLKKTDFLIRFAFVDFNGDKALSDFNGEFTDDFCNNYFARIFEGVNIICDYVRNI